MSELLNLFLSHGLKLKKTDYDILNSSASRGDSEAIKILIDYGFKVKGEPGGLALIDAARGGDIETAKLLINAGADLNATETETSYWVEHFSALTRAAENGRTEMVKLLLDAGADIKILNDKAHRIARKNGQTETLDLIKHYKKMARMKAKQNKKA
jgi:ankyrin repeat protein